jgi:hypothetical protein
MIILATRVCATTVLAIAVALWSGNSEAEPDPVRGDAVRPAPGKKSQAARPPSPEDLAVRRWISGERVDVIASGDITVHPKLASSIRPGGKVHLRLVDIGRLGRPFMFREYTEVKFPLHYELKTSDFVSEVGLRALTQHRYYIEALYYGFTVDGREVPKWEAAVGQGWGTPGRPFPLSFGQTRDIQLSGWDSAEPAGMVPLRQKSDAMGWLWISRGVQEQLRVEQKIDVTLSFFHASDKTGSSPFITTRVGLPKVGEPVHWVVSDDSLLAGTRGYIKASGTAVDWRGRLCHLAGGRASPKVNIDLQTRTLKVVMVEVRKCQHLPPAVAP